MVNFTLYLGNKDEDGTASCFFLLFCDVVLGWKADGSHLLGEGDIRPAHPTRDWTYPRGRSTEPVTYGGIKYRKTHR